jgi:hypothetical protein
MSSRCQILPVLALTAAMAAGCTAAPDDAVTADPTTSESTAPKGAIDWPLVDEPELDPNETDIVVGESYAYTIYTHCGVNWIGMDGDQWKAENPLGNGNPPPGWGQPERGTITVVTETRAVYADEVGNIVTFNRVPDAVMRGCA